MPKKKDYIGLSYGSLTVVEELAPDIAPSGRKTRRFRCICECGCYTEKSPSHLTDEKRIKSCGCLSRYTKRSNHGQMGTPVYRSWTAMKQRTTNENCKRYHDYGGRGIKIEDKRWLEFVNFYMDMGDKPPGMSLDRIDNSKGYFKENCCWATPSEQVVNRRTTKLTEADVYTIKWMRECDNQSYKEISQEFGVSCSHISNICTGKAWSHLK